MLILESAYRIRMGPGKRGKSWKLKISNPGRYIYVLVLESHGKLDFF